MKKLNTLHPHIEVKHIVEKHYNRDKLLTMIDDSKTLTNEEKQELRTAYSSDEDIWESGTLLMSILEDEKNSLERNKQAIKETLLGSN